MEYKISELANLSGVSTRTLRHYDEIGLLIPKRLANSQYRIYDDQHVNQLHDILVLKAMGFDLAKIKSLIMNLKQHDRQAMLERHLHSLIEKRSHIDNVIANVELTIDAMKRGVSMNDSEKFKGLKNDLVTENDRLYKNEVIQKWGHDVYEASTNAFKSLTKEQYDHMNGLAETIITTLKRIQLDKTNRILRKSTFSLHKEWLIMTWGGKYSIEAHYNLVAMYVEDERFKNYYDQHGEGLAELLRDIVQEELILIMK